MLDLRRLRYLIVLAKRLSYSRAAEDLGISQSALSRAVQSLEQELGMRLFDRDRAGVLPTEQGRWVVEKAEGLLTGVKEFEHQVGFAARGEEGRTRFGMTALPASALLPALSTRFSTIPSFIHDVFVGEVEAMWLKLARGELEFMICSEWKSAWPVPDNMSLRTESLGRFPISLIVRKGHPLLGNAPELGEYPLMVSDPASVSGQLTVELRERYAVSVQVIGELSALRSLVRKSDAIWLSSAYAVADDILDGSLEQLPLPPNLEPRSFELFMYSLVRRTKSPSAIAIGDALRKRIKELSCDLGHVVPEPC